MNFVSLGFFMSCSDRHLPCFNERKNEQTNMDAMRKKKFTTFGVYFVMSLCAPAFVKGQVEKSMIFHIGTLQNRNCLKAAYKVSAEITTKYVFLTAFQLL